MHSFFYLEEGDTYNNCQWKEMVGLNLSNEDVSSGLTLKILHMILTLYFCMPCDSYSGNSYFPILHSLICLMEARLSVLDVIQLLVYNLG
jgi:hypothetical protein